MTLDVSCSVNGPPQRDSNGPYSQGGHRAIGEKARSARAEANLERVEAFADELASYPFDDDCAARFGGIKAQMLSAGRPTPDFDLAIAAVAMAHGLTVVTADRHFADVPGLASVDWMK